MTRAIPLGKYGRCAGRAVVCPRCAAGIGRPCTITRGKNKGTRSHEPHRSRLAVAKKACARCGAAPGTPCDRETHDMHNDNTHYTQVYRRAG